jgi:hypothetical protein
VSAPLSPSNDGLCVGLIVVRAMPIKTVQPLPRKPDLRERPLLFSTLKPTYEN